MKRLNKSIRNLIGSIIILVISSSVFYHFYENWNWIDAAYMTIMTITTVGHADLVPSSAISKVFTAIVAFVGIAMVLTLFGIVSSEYVKKTSHDREL